MSCCAFLIFSSLVLMLEIAMLGAALEFLNAVDKAAFTVGKTIFVRGTLEETADLLEHELRHVRQYEVLGDAFWPIYLAGLFAKGQEANPLEKDARDAADKAFNSE